VCISTREARRYRKYTKRIHPLEVAEYLIAHGADLNLQADVEHRCALAAAVSERDVQLVKMLLDHGAVAEADLEEEIKVLLSEPDIT
jgi:ankyrin repeat protein